MKTTDEVFIEIVTSSRSVREALGKLGLANKGGNYKTFHSRVSKLGIDTTHFSGQGWAKDTKPGPKRPIEDYLSNRQPIGSNGLRKRLLAAGIFVPQCSCCKLTEWNGKPIPLELEHRDGNHDNNNLSNLCLLCPNCHAQTPTYRGKNIKR